LYDLGWKRLGCLFCPLSNRTAEKERYPRYLKTFEIFFIKMYDKIKKEHPERIRGWKNGKEMFDWWIDDKRKNEAETNDQSVLFE
jgi:phosphoadenosine phosphosulfate reductase